MLVVYTETWATYTAAVVRIRVDGLTMTNPDSGHTSAHPCVQIANTAAGQLRAFAAEFGLSAVAERRLSVTTCQIPKPMVKLGSNSASSHSCAFAGFSSSCTAGPRTTSSKPIRCPRSCRRRDLPPRHVLLLRPQHAAALQRSGHTAALTLASGSLIDRGVVLSVPFDVSGFRSCGPKTEFTRQVGTQLPLVLTEGHRTFTRPRCRRHRWHQRRGAEACHSATH